MLETAHNLHFFQDVCSLWVKLAHARGESRPEMRLILARKYKRGKDAQKLRNAIANMQVLKRRYEE